MIKNKRLSTTRLIYVMTVYSVVEIGIDMQNTIDMLCNQKVLDDIFQIKFITTKSKIIENLVDNLLKNIIIINNIIDNISKLYNLKYNDIITNIIIISAIAECNYHKNKRIKNNNIAIVDDYIYLTKILCNENQYKFINFILEKLIIKSTI